MSAVYTGTVSADNGKFGFITVDGGSGDRKDMFVMPAACKSFGGLIPPVGTTVRFVEVNDAKTRRPRAEDVEPIDVDGVVSELLAHERPHGLNDSADHAQAHVQAQALQRRTGTVMKLSGSFGFIEQDCGEADMFVMPIGCAAFGGSIPPVGTRVSYIVVLDDKTQRLRADDVQPEQTHVAMPPHHGVMRVQRPQVPVLAAAGSPYAGTVAWCTGTVAKLSGAFGFIEQDSGEADMFVIPGSCAAFGTMLPSIGTRVRYTVTVDDKSGRPRADVVEPLPSAGSRPLAAHQPQYHQLRPQPQQHFQIQVPHLPQQRNQQQWSSHYPVHNVSSGVCLDEHAGTFLKGTDHFGFIQQDSGDPDMFVMPAGCVGFGGMLPAVGSRVRYAVVPDLKTGRPRAENVRPEDDGGYGRQPRFAHGGGHDSSRSQPYATRLGQTRFGDGAIPASQYVSNLSTGTMAKDSGKFGFITVDAGGADMFVMPAACGAFGGALPPAGTRLVFEIVTDAKTGRARAESVAPA